MARLIANSTGNLTSSSTWSVADTTFLVDSENNTTNVVNSTLTTPALTPGAITVDAVLLKVSFRNSSNIGTFTVTLRNTTTSTNVTSVTVNISDIVATDVQGWTTFKFSGSQTLVAANTYVLTLICSDSSTQIGFYRSSTANDFSRMLRTTTTASPGAGDQLIISNEFTGAGTSNSITVTMNNTAATIFGSLSYIDSISVSGKGTLTWGTSSSTNYLLTVAGNITIWAGSTWNRGTSGTRMPSSSTAKLSFSVATATDSGLIVKSGATFNEYGNIVTSDNTVLTASIGGYCNTVGATVTRVRGQSFIGLTGTIVIGGTSKTISSVTDADHLTLTTSFGTATNQIYTHAGTGATLQVSSTSGWVAGDSIGIASTNSNGTQSDQATISSVDSSTEVTLTAALTNTHFSDTPTVAEIVHLTRNVSTYGISASLTCYILINATAIANQSYVEHYSLGSGNTDKGGISVKTTTGSYTAIGCTVHNVNQINCCAWDISGSATNNISITYCHTYDLATYHFRVATTTGTLITLDHCIAMRTNFASGICFNINDVGITCTNLIAAGGTSNCNGFSITEFAEITGTFSALRSHAQSTGFSITSVLGGNIGVDHCYYGSTGFSLTNCMNLTIVGSTCFGNSTVNFATSGCTEILFRGFTIGSDVLYSSPCGFIPTGGCGRIIFENCVFGANSGIYRTHTTGDINLYNGATQRICMVILRNCSLSSTTDIVSQTLIYPAPGTYIASEKHNQTAGLHKRWEKYGTAIIDSTTYRTAAPAETLTPNNAVSKLNSSSTTPIGIKSGNIGNINVYVYKSAGYNGNQPRLILKSNPAIGYNIDTVLATASGSTGSWLLLSGSTPTANDDGAFVCYVDCDGTSGTVTIDDWSAT